MTPDVIGITLELHQKLIGANLDPKEIPKATKFQGGLPQRHSSAVVMRCVSVYYHAVGRNVNLDIDRIVGYRQFCNKLWNVVRYVLYHALGTAYTPKKLTFDAATDAASLSTECKWILSRLDLAVEECNRGFTEGTYDFALTTNATYRFWLYEFCDVFLELTKPTMQLDASDPKKQLTQDVLLYIMGVVCACCTR